MADVLRWITAGESHGPALVAVLEGLPAGVPVTTADKTEDHYPQGYSPISDQPPGP